MFETATNFFLFKLIKNCGKGKYWSIIIPIKADNIIRPNQTMKQKLVWSYKDFLRPQNLHKKAYSQKFQKCSDHFRNPPQLTKNEIIRGVGQPTDKRENMISVIINTDYQRNILTIFTRTKAVKLKTHQSLFLSD